MPKYARKDIFVILYINIYKKNNLYIDYNFFRDIIKESILEDDYDT